MTTTGGKIYYCSAGLTGQGSGSIRVIDANDDGSSNNNEQEVVLISGEDVMCEPDTLEIDATNGKIYWTNMGLGASLDKSAEANSGSISRANLKDGSNVEILVPVGITSTPKQIALDVDGGKMYWSDRGDVGDKYVNPKIMRANLDGSNVETIISSDVLSPVGMALDVPNGKLYFTDRFANNIKRANLDGSNVETFVADTQYPVDLAIDSDKKEIYWTARQAGAVFKTAMMDDNKQQQTTLSNVNGSVLQPIVTGLTAPIGVTLDPIRKKVLYTEVDIPNKSGAIWEANLDGSDARKIATAIMPLGICFLP